MSNLNARSSHFIAGCYAKNTWIIPAQAAPGKRSGLLKKCEWIFVLAVG